MRIAIIVCIFSCSSFYVNTNAFSLRDELSPFFSVRDDISQCPHSPHPTCTTKSGAAPNVPCVFPFLVNNEKMWSCTTAGGFPDPWCATGVDPSDCSILRDQWGDCDEETCDGVFEPTTTERQTVGPECANINTDDDCVTVDGPQTNAPCWFPFKSQGVTYTTCTTRGGYPEPWCATLVDDDCNMVLNHWGTCHSSCPNEDLTTTVTSAPPPECYNTNTDCATVSGEDTYEPCWFPFKIRDEIHYTCTFDGGYPEPWCPTRVDQNCRVDGAHWGNCDSSCPNENQSSTTVAPTTETTLGSTTENTGMPTTEHTDTSVTEHTEMSTTGRTETSTTSSTECYNTNTDCVTVSGEDTNEPCWFPFKIRDEIHYTCTFDGGYPQPWCPTRVDQNCRVTGAHWGDCDPTCPNEKQSTTTVATTSETIDTSTIASTTENTGTPTTEQTGSSTTEHTEASTTEHTVSPITESTVPPTPEDCWYDYLCNTIINIGEGSGEDLVNASTCQAACKAQGGCKHFTWRNYHGSPRCWFLETCDKEDICPSPDYCKSGPANCGDLPEPCTHLEYTTGDNIIHWVAFDDLNPYIEPIPYGTTCITSPRCDTWKNATGPVAEVLATCQSGTNWTLIPPDVTYADGSPFPKPSQGDPDC